MKYLLALTLALGCGATFAQAGNPPAGKGRGFARFNLNSDGYVDKSEAEKAPRLAERFGCLNTDKDGRLSKE